jgi:hypothetical protein
MDDGWLGRRINVKRMASAVTANPNVFCDYRCCGCGIHHAEKRA